MNLNPLAYFRIQKKSVSNPTPEELALFTGQPVGSNALSQAMSLTVPSVASAIALISGSIAALDLNVERFDGKTWVADKEHAVAKLLADQPNEWTSTFELVRDLVATALTQDRGGLAFVNKVGGEVREIVRYEPAHYSIDYSADGRMEPFYRIGNRPVAADEVIHLKGPFSRSPLSLAADAIGVAKVMEQHASQLFGTMARPGGVVSVPGEAGEDAIKKMIAGWKAAFSGKSSNGKTAFLYGGATWQQMTLSSVDAQFLELWKHIILEVCRAFRIPPQMLYDLDRATWANAEQGGKEWLAGLEFWLMPLEAAMRRALFSAEERGTYRIRFERDDYSDVDLTARATAAATLISCRAMSPNDARKTLLDLPPYEGGDEYANPNTGSSQPGGTVEKDIPDENVILQEPANDA